MKRQKPHQHHPQRTSKTRRAETLTTTPPPRFHELPSDLLLRIAAPFDAPTLRSASSVCRSWFDALRPLREGMLLFLWGKRFRHGVEDGDPDRKRGGGNRTGAYVVRRNPRKALDAFERAAGRGLAMAMAMVDAGLMYWEMGMRDEGMRMYRRAAELGHPAGMCNLALAYSEGEKPELQKAVELFRKASVLGYAKAQYNLALYLQHGLGVRCDMEEAVTWYLRAAKGGYARAVYNLSLCYSFGEGLPHNSQESWLWLKRAASCGHKRAQMDLGTQLLMMGDNIKAFVYLELASRAGETDATFLRDQALQSLSETSKDRAMRSVDHWRPHRLCS